ncbi:MAG TPA: hypothetical protein VEU51_04570 [Candidatus Acidoferrales bacterium]|nr:hypothetical protein [Candidatus Acidoferrales bacterium]
MIEPSRRRLRYSQVDLRESVGANSIEILARELAQQVPELRDNAVAIVDSPRCPLDLECSTAAFSLRANAPATRNIDSALRTLVRAANSTRPAARRIRFSLFPTPRRDYFDGCLRDDACKPHLRAFGAQLFATLGSTSHSFANPRGGALFTRFMLAGFATHLSLARMNVASYEGYPYLAFKMWMNCDEKLPPKSKRRADRARALKARTKILERLWKLMPSPQAAPPADCDQADAAILATTLALASTRSRAGAIAEIRSRAEGRFIVAVPSTDAEALSLARASLAAALPA